MKTIVTLSAALLLAATASDASLAQGKGQDNGNGKGNDKREERGQRDDHPGKGGGKPNREERGDRGERDKDRDKPDKDRGDRVVVVQPEQGRYRERDRDRERVDVRRERDERVIVVAPERERYREERVVVVDRPVETRYLVLTPYRDYGYVRGCPPGLAKKNNGCLPPGQAKKLQRARHDWMWDRRAGFARDDDWRYDDGYLYRYDRGGSLQGWLPALGGALATGNVWPSGYQYDPAPQYLTNYYGANDQGSDYRYANGALYGVNPQTSSIQSVLALLTGQTAQVGQRMPPGFDVYNVPYDHRGQYYDTPDSQYRYNDGAIYQVNPNTKIVQAIIQLLT